MISWLSALALLAAATAAAAVFASASLISPSLPQSQSQSSLSSPSSSSLQTYPRWSNSSPQYDEETPVAVATFGAASSHIKSSIVQLVPSETSSIQHHSSKIDRINQRHKEKEEPTTTQDVKQQASSSHQEPSKSSIELSSSISRQQEETLNGAPKITNNNKTLESNKFASFKNSQPPIYTNQFVIQVEGGEEEARKLALKYGFVYLNHILGDYYHLEHRRLSKRSLNPSQDVLNISIQDEPKVLLLERQVLKKRVKRDFLDLPPPPNYQNVDNQNANYARSNNQQGSQLLLQQQQQQQLLQQQQRNSLRSGLQQAQSRPSQHGQYTRPANQPPAQPHPGQRIHLGPNRLNSMRLGPTSTGGGHTPPPLLTDSGHNEPRTMEILESAATSLLYQQAASLAGAGLTASTSVPLGHKQRPQLAPSNASFTQMPHTNKTGAKSDRRAPFNDPSWPLMWYLDGGAKNGFDLNVMAAWKMGYTGKGIVITILDDGLEKDHPDLQANYDPLASFDINGDDADPMPRYDINDSNRHGTRCAGEVAAVPDNNICSIGIAYNSKVGGVRMLDGDVTDAVEARSLGLNNQHIHIYSASWGPDDNGKTVDGPGEMATRAFIDGVTNGRQGLGSIFVFASGNGGREHDNCNCDGYTNSIWTLSISSATENGYVPWYIEACSSTLATTYSSGSYEERQIATTDLHHSCTSSHTGTSASAPLAAGICALVLESNPKLTWRDMQHIVVRTAKPANLIAKDWRTNALGRNVSHAFGYGLMDAAAMITMAKRWTTVPVQYTCEVRSPQMEKFIPSKGYIELKLRAECSNVRFLEHVQSKVTLTSSRRGDLHIYLISPHGTRSTLLAQRPNDQAEQGFRNWPFMTVHSWGESPNGIWTLEVHNDGKPQNRAYLKEWTLILYGTYDDPNRLLDPIQATTTPQSTTTTTTGNTPTATFTLEPHHSKHQSTIPPPTVQGSQVSSGTQSSSSSASSSSSPGLNKPSASNPPPPINQYPTEPTNTQPNRPWLHSYSSPAPPPPPPLPPVVTSMPPKVASSSPYPPTTTSTTSSYVTTFKTIVSTPSSSSATPSSPPPPSSPSPLPPNLSSQQHAQGNSGTGRVQIDQSGQIIKADFEVVSPPSLPATTTTTTTTSTNFNTLQQTDPRFRPPPQGELGFTHNYNTTLFDVNSIAKLKPPVNQIDSNKIDVPTTVPTNRLTVSQQDLQGNSNNNNNNTHNNNSNNNGQQQNQHELIDGQNQIGSKLTKDYRSSGDQSSNYFSATKTTTTTNDLNADSANKVQTKLVDQQNSAANLGAQPSLTLILVALIGVFASVSSSNYLRLISDYLIFSNSIHVVRPKQHIGGAIFC